MVTCHLHNIVLVSSAFHWIFFQVTLGALTHRELLKVISKPKLSESQKHQDISKHRTYRQAGWQSEFLCAMFWFSSCPGSSCQCSDHHHCWDHSQLQQVQQTGEGQEFAEGSAHLPKEQSEVSQKVPKDSLSYTCNGRVSVRPETGSTPASSSNFKCLWME